MEVLGTGYIKVRYTKKEIIEKFTTPICTPWIEFEFTDGSVELGCECGHCDGIKVRLIGYIKAQKRSC